MFLQPILRGGIGQSRQGTVKQFCGFNGRPTGLARHMGWKFRYHVASNHGVLMSVLSIAAANAILTDNFAPWVLASEIKVEVLGADSAKLRIPFAPQLCRVGGILCGQALLTGADTAMVIALAAASGGFRPCTTVDLTINYMRPITRADALLEAVVMRLGKSLAFCTCEVRASQGKRAAFSTGTYAFALAAPAQLPANSS